MELIYILIICILYDFVYGSVIDLGEMQKYIINNNQSSSIFCINTIDILGFSLEYAYIKFKVNNGVFKSNNLNYGLSNVKRDNISINLNVTNYDKMSYNSSEIYYYKINPKESYSKSNYIYFKYPIFEGDSLEIINLSSSLIFNAKEIKKYGTYTIEGNYDFTDKIFYINLTSFKWDEEIYLELSVYDGQLLETKFNYRFYSSELTETDADSSLNSKVDCYHQGTSSNSDDNYEPGIKWEKKKYYYKLENKGYKYLFFKIPLYFGDKVEIQNAKSSIEETIILLYIIIPIVTFVIIVALIVVKLYKKCTKRISSNRNETLNFPESIGYDPVIYQN